MALLSKVSFDVPTTNEDGTALTEAVTYTVLIDTVNPPVKGYLVPSADAPISGVLTATFAQLGFTPVNGGQYYAAAEAVDASGTSGMSNVVGFIYAVPPAAPTGFTVG